MTNGRSRISSGIHTTVSPLMYIVDGALVGDSTSGEGKGDVVVLHSLLVSVSKSVMGAFLCEW